ncbi:hypothetical protein BU17DRAFT_91800 [Hysterangium stoloniferum]|nr:hypothetical protein BU17DRAFT_91800 [Hysterangium stoloniferum]
MPEPSAQYLDLLATDFSPSCVQTLTCQSVIADAEVSIQQLDIEINKLLVKKHALVETAAIMKAVISPIRKLPTEILGEIFLCYISRPYSGRDPNFTNAVTKSENCPSSFPLLHVCRRWRRVGFKIPRLFSKLVLGDMNAYDPLIMIPTWLEHAGSLNLDVLIYPPHQWHYPKFSSRTKSFRNACELIRTHICRFEHIRTFSGEALEIIFPAGTSTIVPALRSLKIELDYLTYEPDERIDFQFGRVVAPNLEAIGTGTGCPPSPSWSFITFHTDRLRTFRHDGGENSLKILMELLRQCPNLEVALLFYVDPSDAVFPPSMPPILLPQLEHLEIIWEDDEHGNIVEFLMLLRVPRLKQLSLMRHIEAQLPQASIVTGLTSVLVPPKGSLPPLEHLALSNIDIPPKDMASILQKHPGLTQLTLSTYELDDETLDQLTFSPERPLLCPNLTSMGFVGITVSPQNLIKMIESRFKGRCIPPKKPDADLPRIIFLELRAFSNEDMDALMARKHDLSHNVLIHIG